MVLMASKRLSTSRASLSQDQERVKWDCDSDLSFHGLELDVHA